jgi:RNAse (barnase) inhibitor barstar
MFCDNMKPIITINGMEFDDIESFAKHFSKVALNNQHCWNGNLDAFNDILRGGFGTPEEGFIIEWRNHDKSKRELGITFRTIVEIIKDHGIGGDESEDGVELRLK